MTNCPFLNFRFSGFKDKSSKLILENLLVRLEIGSGFCGFVDTNDDGGDDDDDDDDDVNDDDGDDEDVGYWQGKSDVGTSICEDGEWVLELLSKEVSFELIEYCSSPESLSM